jgi:membrane protein involved in colicin uptake
MRLPAIVLLISLPVAASAQSAGPQESPAQQYVPTGQLLAQHNEECEAVATNQFLRLTKANADLKAATDQEREAMKKQDGADLAAAKKQAADEAAALRSQVDAANQRANENAAEHAKTMALLDKANERIHELETAAPTAPTTGGTSGPGPKLPPGSVHN